MSQETAGLLSVDEALARVIDGAVPLGAERVGLAEARLRVSAEAVAAILTQPPFDASAMDGYAVRAVDVAQVPALLRIIGTAAAGGPFGGTVGASEAVRIFTGAPVPPGADAVVIQEDTRRNGDHVSITEAAVAGRNVRPRGFDFGAGDILFAAGRILTARDLSLAAAAGHATLNVWRRPTVAVIPTGDELVAPGEMPGVGQIVSSVPIGVAGLIAQAGGAVSPQAISRDTLASLAQSIAAAASADVIVTIGGASVGDHDLVKNAFAAAGIDLDFWKIAMRPGKPLVFGRREGQRVLGLPGNPVSALLCARIFLVPLLRAMTGVENAPETLRRLPLAAPLEANGPRRHYVRAATHIGPLGATVTPLPSQDSSLTRALAAADCLIVQPPLGPALPAGTEVDVLSLDF